MIMSVLKKACALAVLFSNSLLVTQAQTTTYKSSQSNSTATRMPAKSQEKKGGFDVNRLIYGGGVYGGGGSNMISLGLSPIVGYAITDFWSAGISLGYKYTYYRDFFQVYDYDWQKWNYYNLNAHVFVPGIWTRLKVFKNFFTHFEYENVVTTYKHHGIDGFGKHEITRNTDVVPCLLLGVGLRQPISERASFVYYALYDVLQNIPSNTVNPGNGAASYSLSPYARTIDLRIGINVGF